MEDVGGPRFALQASAILDMIPTDTHLQIGSLLFDGLDQNRFDRPFRGVLARSQTQRIRCLRKHRRPCEMYDDCTGALIAGRLVCSKAAER
jgi:hypothetical protein